MKLHQIFETVCAMLVIGCATTMTHAQDKVALVSGGQTGSAQSISGLSSQEIEQRNAAAGFVFPMEATLGMLRTECQLLLPDQNTGVNAIALGWWTRNKADLDAAFVWTDQYLSFLKDTDTAKHRIASAELANSTLRSVLSDTRLYFKRQLPTVESCTYALKRYSVPNLDIQRIAGNPGFEKFAEFGSTLKRIRLENGYQIPPHLKLDFTNVRYEMLASRDAVDAATERKDWGALRQVLESMAERADGKAAVSLGVMYLNGNLIGKNDSQAYRWFYAGWSLGEYSGLNAMGVMWRDGLNVHADPRIAYASFALAAAASRAPVERDRADQNRRLIEASLKDDDRSFVTCLSISELDRALKKPVDPSQLLRGRSLTQADRVLGQILPNLHMETPPGGCK